VSNYKYEKKAHLIEVSVDEWMGEGGRHTEQVTHGEGETESDITGAPLLPLHTQREKQWSKYCRRRRE
jgi:hypothetical protein